MALLILAPGIPVIPLCDGKDLIISCGEKKTVTDVYFLLRLSSCKLNYTFIVHLLSWQQDLHARLLPLLCFSPTRSN